MASQRSPSPTAGVSFRMNRGLVVVAALAATAVVAVSTGLLLGQVTAPSASRQPVALKSSTPGALDAQGVHLTQAAVPPGCTGLPFRFPGCPINQSAAEAAALKQLGGSAQNQAHVKEAVLARVDIDAQSRLTAHLHAIEWAVAVDRNFPGALMCVQPAVPGAKIAMMPACGVGRFLVFVDAATATPTLEIARP